MMNGLDIHYTSKNIGRGLKPISNDKQQTNSNIGRGLKPISKCGKCKKVWSGLKILQ